MSRLMSFLVNRLMNRENRNLKLEYSLLLLTASDLRDLVDELRCVHWMKRKNRTA